MQFPKTAQQLVRWAAGLIWGGLGADLGKQAELPSPRGSSSLSHAIGIPPESQMSIFRKYTLQRHLYN